MNRIKLLSSCLRSFPVFVNMMGRGVIKRKGHTVYMHIYIYLTLIQSINESVDENGVRYFLFIFFFLLRLSVSMFASFICTMFKYLIGTIFNYGGREEYSCLSCSSYTPRKIFFFYFSSCDIISSVFFFFSYNIALLLQLND